MVINLLLMLAVAQPTTFLQVVAEGMDSPIREHLEVVVRTPAEWRALSSRFAPDRPPEAVDFAHEMLLAVFASPGYFSGHWLEIFSVAREGDRIAVRFRRQRRRLAEASVDSAPYQIVAVPRDPRPAEFIEVREPGGRQTDE